MSGVNIDFVQHKRDLAAGLTGPNVPRGRLLGLPELPGEEAWVDIAGASILVPAPVGTITSWLSRGSPVSHPFPDPREVLYRLYWPESVIRAWRDLHAVMPLVGG